MVAPAGAGTIDCRSAGAVAASDDDVADEAMDEDEDDVADEDEAEDCVVDEDEAEDCVVDEAEDEDGVVDEAVDDSGVFAHEERVTPTARTITALHVRIMIGSTLYGVLVSP